MTPVRRFAIKRIAILVLAVLLLPLSGATPQAAGLKKVSLQLKWLHQFQFAGYYAAKHLGFYRAAGLDVEILEGGPGIRVLDIVLQGDADFGVLGGELAFHRAQGKKVVILAPMIQHSQRVIIARADRGIASPHDLPGRTIMLNKSELPEFAAMFFKEGVSMDLIQILDKDRTANGKFIRGDIDALNGSVANQPFLFSREHIGYTLIRPLNYGIDFYGDTLFTTEAMVRRAPDTAGRFLTASIKGWQHAFANPEEAADLILATYSKKKSKSHLMFEQARLRELCHPDLVEIGHNNPERWYHILQAYETLDLVPKDASLQGFLYRDYLDTKTLWLKWILWGVAGMLMVFVLVTYWNLRLRLAVRKMTEKIRESRERIRITLDAIGDGVIATDGTGCIVRMNPVAEKLTGWDLEQARGKYLDQVFRIINSKNGETAESPVQKVLAGGQVVGLADHTALIARDGTHRQIADSGAPIFDQDRKIVGVVVVFRDMTEEYYAQKLIRENERKFRSYMQNAPYGIFVMDPSGRVLESNQAMARIFGYGTEELRARMFDGLLPGPAAQEEGGGLFSISQALEAGRSHGVVSVARADTRSRVCEVDLVRLNRNRILGFVHDISRRKAIEARAIDLAMFPSENPSPVLRVDSDGCILYANKGSRILLDAWHTAMGDPIPSPWKERVADSFAGDVQQQFEEPLGAVCLSLVITPVKSHGYVNIYGMDISEQYRTRALLKKSEEKYRELVEGTNDLIISIDDTGVVMYANRIVEKHLGISQDAAAGISLFKFVHPDDRERTKTWFENCVGAKAPGASFENRLVNARTQAFFYMHWTCNFHYDQDGSLKTVNCIARDMTTQKALEVEKKLAEENLRQAFKMEAVGNIAGGIAHDFNNILGIIIGNVELALEDLSQWNPAGRNLEEIKIAGLRASEVVKQLLSFSRKSELFKKVMQLQPIIEESVTLLRASIPTSIDIHVDIRDDTGAIEADPTQIHQILINLCTNAAHAMDMEGGTLGIGLDEAVLDSNDVRLFGDIAPGHYAVLSISDTGHGIDRAVIPKIFDPYFTTKKVGKGTGMGLAVVHGIVKSYSGGIRVESEKGRGSVFRVVFPLTAADAVSDTKMEARIPTGTGRILLVDDEAALLKMGKKQLESLGYQVEAWQDPVDALASFASGPAGFNLVLTDMTMPRMTGDQLVEKILDIRPGMPVLLCTGYSSKMDQQRSLDIGVSGYIEKPFDRIQLALAVEEALLA